jgi:hypothetical protein
MAEIQILSRPFGLSPGEATRPHNLVKFPMSADRAARLGKLVALNDSMIGDGIRAGDIVHYSRDAEIDYSSISVFHHKPTDGMILGRGRARVEERLAERDGKRVFEGVMIIRIEFSNAAFLPKDYLWSEVEIVGVVTPPPPQ